MITQAALSSYDSSFQRFFEKDAMNERSNYVNFKYIFRTSSGLTYEQKVNVLAKVIRGSEDTLHDLSQKIEKFALKCGITLNPLDSNKAITTHLDRIVEGLDKITFLHRKNAARKECVKMLVPFAYELIRQKKIHEVLEPVYRAFSKCGIKLPKYSLSDIPFISQFSTELCSNTRFLGDNPLEAIKYCFPHTNDMIEDFIRCCSFLELEIYPYEKLYFLFNEMFESHYKQLGLYIAHNRLFMSLSVRVAFAEAVNRVDPDYLAAHFLSLFKEHEIFDNYKFSELLNGLWMGLFEKMNGRTGLTADYFKFVHLYLNNWRLKAHLRIPGSELINRMQEEKAQGKPFSKETCYSKDTPIWREIAASFELGGVDRVFKLDWDFDPVHLRTPYAKKHKESIEKTGINPELHNLIFPALILYKTVNGFNAWWTPILRYFIIDGPSGKYISLPEPGTILDRWKYVLADPRAKEKGVYQNLSIAVTEGSVTPEEYLSLFMEHDVICSMTSEFAHDHQYHIIPTIGAIMTSTAEEYTESLNCAREWVKVSQQRIHSARQNLTPKEDETMLKVLEFTLGIFADGYTIMNDVKKRNIWINSLFWCQGVLAIWGGENETLWRGAFSNHYKQSNPYPASRIQECWHRIIGGWVLVRNRIHALPDYLDVLSGKLPVPSSLIQSCVPPRMLFG